LNVRFLRPVREDDVITAGGRLKAFGSPGYELWVRNQNDELVITGEAAIDPSLAPEPAA
jgi:acyl-coenzyme A thioesterase PaaI-like protein